MIEFPLSFFPVLFSTSFPSRGSRFWGGFAFPPWGTGLRGSFALPSRRGGCGSRLAFPAWRSGQRGSFAFPSRRSWLRFRLAFPTWRSWLRFRLAFPARWSRLSQRFALPSWGPSFSLQQVVHIAGFSASQEEKKQRSAPQARRLWQSAHHSERTLVSW